MRIPLVTVCAALVSGAVCASGQTGQVPGGYAVALSITTDLSYSRTPLDPVIDFGRLIARAGLDGELDPNSIRIIDAATGTTIPHGLSEDFHYSDFGTVEWVAEDPSQREFLIVFRLVDERPPLAPSEYVPLVGVGDLLRYNAGQPRPFTMAYLSGLFDLNGDGKRDLAGCWNYAYRPGWPWDGIVTYPRFGGADVFEFGDLVHLRYIETIDSREHRDFSSIYMQAGFGDLNGDGRLDLVYSPRAGNVMQVFLNSGRTDDGGFPLFLPDVEIPRPGGAWGPVRIVDLDQDGTVDIALGAMYTDQPVRMHFLRNANADGWPLDLEEPAPLDVAEGACFFDVDGDGWLDAVGLAEADLEGVRPYRIVWQRGLGGAPPVFDEPEALPGLEPFWPSSVAAVREGPRTGLLVLHEVFQRVSFFEHVPGGEPPFAAPHTAESVSAVMALSDQAWPCVCDWEGDGDPDLLVGGGYGWPRIVINQGTAQRPAFAEARRIEAGGEPLRLLRNDLLGEPHHWHNMGYPYPVYVDWSNDGLPDLVIPNETNRLFWYENTGSREAPVFGERQQIVVDGFPETPETRRRSAERALEATYPVEEDRPFFWRTRAGFADWNRDGLMDLVTLNGADRNLTLFTQYKAEDGGTGVKMAGPLKLTDGRVINDSVVGRTKHWTEGFVCVDWDGDDLMDIVYSCAGTHPAKGSIYLLTNVGAPGEPVFDEPRTMCCFGTPIKVTDHGPHPWAGDLDGDGKPDLVTCVEWSVYPFYTHAALEMPKRPRYTLGEVKPFEGAAP